MAATGVIGGVAGYWWRERAGRRRSLAVSLYLLMEIWHRISILQRTSFDFLLQQLEEKLTHRYPDAKFEAEELAAVKRYFEPILDALVRKSAFEGFESLHDAYAEAVRLVAQQDPLLAYRLDGASNIKRRLDFFDNYLTQTMPPLEASGEVSQEFSALMQRKMREYAGRDTAADIQQVMKSLALRYSVWAYLRVLIVVWRRNRKLQSDLTESVEKMFDDVIAPILDETQQIASSGA